MKAIPSMQLTRFVLDWLEEHGEVWPAEHISDAARILQAYKDDLLEQAARIAEAPITGNGHSSETRARAEVVNTIARNIRDLKTPQPKRVRRLK